MLCFCQKVDAGADIPMQRVAGALGLIGPDSVFTHRLDDRLFAWVRIGRLAGPEPFFRAPTGCTVLFDGWFDNLQAICAELGLGHATPAQAYAGAIERWGDEADRRIVGCYSAIAAFDDGCVRLSRSPINAAPLSFCIVDGLLVVASLPRILLSAGLPSKLSERKLADNLFLNLAEGDGWFEGSMRLGLGATVWYGPGKGLGVATEYFDIRDVPALPKASDADYLEEAERLLREAAGCCLQGASRPGVFLSGGRDSSNVAARLLEVMPRQQALPAFTFVPGPDWDRKDAPGTFGDERARVEAFARFHERIEPHFIDNAGRNFDYGLDKLFLATGAAPTGLCNVWMHHGIYESARDEGCDLLLCADIGNQTFSAEGMWAPAEYFRAGKWSEAWRALESGYCVDKPLWRRFTAHCLGGQVGDPAWRSWQAFKGARTQSANELVGSLRAGTADRFDSVGRAKLRGVFYDRPTVGSRKAALFRAFSRGDKEGGEIELGFAQLYGIRSRDVTAYRPLVEFCAGLPTRMFMRGGQRRWLARQLGIGRLPEAQRLEGRHGVHNADWHARMTPHLADMRAEFVAASANPFLNAIIDYRKVIADIDSWPTQTRFDRDTQLRHAMGIARALLVTRFVKHVNGWNAY